jgi:hypothetical protein
MSIKYPQLWPKSSNTNGHHSSSNSPNPATTHWDYLNNMTAWSRARDILAGEDAIKQAGERYLPCLENQTRDEYEAYKSRALFFNATARTAEAYLGLIFRRAPFIKVPENPRDSLTRIFTRFRNDSDLQGTTFEAYAKQIVSEVIAIGRACTVIDYESQSEHRPYIARYLAEQVLNWRTGRIGGRTVLTMVSLEENISLPNDPNDLFEAKHQRQIRVLRLVDGQTLLSLWTNRPNTLNSPIPNSGYGCVAEIYRQNAENSSTLSDKKPAWYLAETRVPSNHGQALPFIPLVFHGPVHSLPKVQKLPLADIIAVNLDHYRLDADYKHGMHYTALPTAWVTGFDRSTELRIGSSTAWVSDSPGATAGFLEFKGQGLSTFERAMDRDEKLMAVLGSRLLEGQKKVGEAAQAIELRQAGENSILSSLATSVSQSLTQVLRWIYWWNSIADSPEDVGPDKVLVELNTDFSTKGMDPQELSAIVAAWQAGAISRDTMTDLFRRGEVLPEGRTDEEELRALSDFPVSKPSPITDPSTINNQPSTAK